MTSSILFRRKPVPVMRNGVKIKGKRVLRLRRSRGYAQHERPFFSVFSSPARPERSEAKSKGALT